MSIDAVFYSRKTNLVLVRGKEEIIEDCTRRMADKLLLYREQSDEFGNKYYEKVIFGSKMQQDMLKVIDELLED